jgi:anti-sigma B factor antagonist
MKLIPPDSQDAGRRGSATGDEGRPIETAAPRLSRRRFTFDFALAPRATLITLGGEFDVVCADSFKRRFAEATEDEPKRVVMDVRNLTFIDSTGLSLLLSVNEMSRDRGFALWIVSAEDDPPGKIFRLTGTHTILPLVDELPDLGAAS